MSSSTSPFRQALVRSILDDTTNVVRLACAGLFSTALSLAIPHASRIIFDQALPDASPRLMAVIALAVLFLGAHQAWVHWLQSSISIALGNRVEEKALQRAVGALVHCDPQLLREKNSGWMVTTLEGASTSAQRYVSLLGSSTMQGLALIGYLISLAVYAPGVAAVVVTVELVITAGSLLLAQVEGGYVQRRLEHDSEQNQYLHSLLARLASLRGLFATDRLAGEWGQRVRRREAADLKGERVEVKLDMLRCLGGQGLSIGILVWSVIQCFRGTLTIGEMMFLSSTSAGLSRSVQGIIGTVVQVRSLTPYAGRVDELLRGARFPKEPPRSLVTDDRIFVDRAWFRYSEESPWVIEDHSWEVRREEVVHLRARSGSGKTTLLRMIAGLTSPARGSASVFGLDARQARDLVLYVPQHCELFETSIRENLELFSGATRSEILHVSHLTGLTRMLKRLPMGEETLVAAQGQNLSSGQRQMILLTAAFASSRPVLLLDEATSQMDAEMRARCQWDQLLSGRTAIIVEHG